MTPQQPKPKLRLYNRGKMKFGISRPLAGDNYQRNIEEHKSTKN